MKYVRLIRPKHYLKNILIILPLIFGRQLLSLKLYPTISCGIISFCLMASAIYIINDIKDIESDRMHTLKCKRPIASGEIPVPRALIISIALAMISVLINVSIIHNFLATGILLLYFSLNFVYSVGRVKDIPLLDIIILVIGFLLRVFYGSVITGVNVSEWLYLVVISASFYLALGKRRNELKREELITRNVLKYYTIDFLDKNMYMCMALTIVFYSLWSVDSSAIMQHANKGLIWTVPIVILILMKYSLNVEGNSDGDPVEVILGDKVLLGIILFYAFVMYYLVYGF